MSAIINYNSITLNNKELSLSSTIKVSFIPPYNEILINFTPTTSLNIFMAKITNISDEYDLECGVTAIYETNIQGNVMHSTKLMINPINFNAGDITYRISLYGCDAATGLWDITYLFMSLNENTHNTWDKFIVKDSADFITQSSSILENQTLLDYTWISNIKSSGSQNIITDVSVVETDLIKIECGIKWTADTIGVRQLMGWSAASNEYFGINDSGNYESGGFNTGIKPSVNSYDIVVFEKYYNSSKSLNYNRLVVNDALLRDGTTSNNTGNIRILSLGSGWFCYASLYYFKIWKNNTLIIDAYPALRKSDNKPGMYDKKTNTFYSSGSSTDFLYE